MAPAHWLLGDSAAARCPTCGHAWALPSRRAFLHSSQGSSWFFLS